MENILFKCQNATEAIDTILNLAFVRKASDIHCDPRASAIEIRFRIDGIISPIGCLPRQMLEEFISRLKILGGARTDIHAIPQDGRWQTDISGLPHNIRISFMPTYFGENAVIRILPATAIESVSFAKLGFIPDHAHALEKSLHRTHGLVLVTGPTGSGKTTTLHTLLSMKSTDPVSIITLEDPIEYEITGVRQIHIRHTHGVTFASGLRSALRQDPDVIMVGEIRDGETAKVAIHTALTGHLVFSTLHTNTAIDVIPRLIDMGVDRYLLAATLKMVVAQRLVRTTCSSCVGVGCEGCHQSGYRGRTVIAEIFEVDEKIRKMIYENADNATILGYLQAHAFRSVLDDGKEKVDWGITTTEEIMRVLSEE